MQSGLALALVIGAAASVALAGCSLLAPSDAELMGGAKDASDDGASDGGDGGGASDAAATDGGGDASCLPTGSFCNGVPSRCCAGTCNAANGRKCD